MKTQKAKEGRILLYEDKQGFAKLNAEVEQVCMGANQLIQIYHSFQEFERITSLKMFEKLVSDPVKAMDDILVKQINVEMTGKIKLDPKAIANLAGIQYDNYLRTLKGEVLDESTCKPCGKIAKTSKNGNAVLSNAEFKKYRQYLNFDGSSFTVNEDAVNDSRESFNHYIDDPKQIEVHSFWNSLRDSLNDAHRRGYLDLPQVQDLTKGRLLYVPHLDQLTLDEQSLVSEILNCKQL